MFRQSIRIKIVIWNLTLLTLALFICGAIAYHWFKWELFHNLDDLLSSRAQGIVESIETYWDTEKQSALNQGIPTTTLSKINNINFLKIARHWFDNESGNADLSNIGIEIYDYNNHLLASSIIANKWSPQEIRSLSISVKENEHIAYIVKVATSTNDVQSQLKHLRFILFGILPVIIFLIGCVSLFLAHISLSPIDQMIKTINSITSKNMHAQMTVAKTGDELQRLAETFNSMLQRIHQDALKQQQFIEDISHEIKTPLTIMRGSMEVALKRQRDTSRYEQLINDNLEQINNLNRIIETLLMLAKFDNHEIASQHELVNLGEIINKAIEEIDILAISKEITIDILLQEQVIVLADAHQLKTAILNILDNAIKYTASKGRITVMISKENTNAIIAINDTGIGIPASDLPHIFDRFYRSSPLDKQEKGFGLGLSLVKSIIENHQGVVIAESTPGQGTRFLIKLPLQ